MTELFFDEDMEAWARRWLEENRASLLTWEEYLIAKHNGEVE